MLHTVELKLNSQIQQFNSFFRLLSFFQFSRVYFYVCFCRMINFFLLQSVEFDVTYSSIIRNSDVQFIFRFICIFIPNDEVDSSSMSTRTILVDVDSMFGTLFIELNFGFACITKQNHNEIFQND